MPRPRTRRACCPCSRRTASTCPGRRPSLPGSLRRPRRMAARRTLFIRGDDPDPAALTLASAALRAGELVIYPTDTLYALGAQASNALAVGRVRMAKGREAEKALPLVASDAAHAATLSASWPAAARVLASSLF